MKKFINILIAVLLFTTISAQRKVTTEKLQVTSLKNTELLKTDANGNLVKGEFPKESDPTVPVHVKSITTENIANWDNKLDANTKIAKHIRLRSGLLNNKFSALDVSEENVGMVHIDDNLQVFGVLGRGIQFSVMNMSTQFDTMLQIDEDGIELSEKDLNNIDDFSVIDIRRKDHEVYIGANKNDLAGGIIAEAGKVTLNATSGSEFGSKLQVTAISISLGKLVKLVPSVAPSSSIRERGMIYFDMKDNKLKCYDGTTWQNLY